jgi:hypothetical protein
VRFITLDTLVTGVRAFECALSVEGGGGVANLNGNVWSGNVTKTIDPCIPPQ